jgi:hypothetical protein
MTTIEDFWRDLHHEHVRWRTATKKAHTCGQCKRTIEIGERYLDTGEAIAQWQTAKCCAECAGTETR